MGRECVRSVVVDHSDFLNPSHHVRDTLEQIDVARNIMAAYPDTVGGWHVCSNRSSNT